MKDECRIILEKAESKLKTAGIDLDAGQYDDSVSRSYYSVFHAITACLLYKGLSFSSHSQVIGAFNREFIKTNTFPPTFSKDIQALFDDRQSGDYDVYSPINRETAELDYKKADNIIKAIKEFLSKTE
ncbi:MAG: HEPN domain-containing protein [Spirochaetia bacterium]|nr:HEPN domain-containing protein [Spirochaetia bacterium]